MKGLKVSNETKVGALTAIAITLLVLGYNFLKGKDLFTKTKIYYAVYERVDGLVASNPVTINGYRIGQVTNVALMPDDSMKLRVRMEIVGSIDIGEGSVARIYNVDFFGSKAIEILLSGNPKTVEDGGQLNSQLEPSLQSSLSTAINPLKAKIEALVVSLDSIVGGSSGENLQSAVASLSVITKNFESTSQQIDKLVADEGQRLHQIFGNVVAISENLKNNNENINTAITNLRKLSDTLAAANIKQVVANAENALKEVAAITEKINKGEGSIGLLVNDKKLYENLEKSSASLDALLKDMKEHPKRYVHFSIFGKKDKK